MLCCPTAYRRKALSCLAFANGQGQTFGFAAHLKAAFLGFTLDERLKRLLLRLKLEPATIVLIADSHHAWII
jgi:hypothetical protein